MDHGARGRGRAFGAEGRRGILLSPQAGPLRKRRASFTNRCDCPRDRKETVGSAAMSGGTSVIIPVRNGARFVREAIESALVQLSADDEVIVVDDASDDDTGGVVRQIDDRRIRLLDGTGRGVSSA